ncbi:SirB2 family protein [Glaesserella parasuis]|uniref:SirB2 family protein n=1 Tax=Glaesserella parasuis TaxID=738 RepID=UPI0018E3DE44
MQILGSWSPFTETWLAIKLLLVVVYIVFGVVAQKNIRTPKGFAFYSLSLLAFFNNGVAIALQNRLRRTPNLLTN